MNNMNPWNNQIDVINGSNFIRKIEGSIIFEKVGIWNEIITMAKIKYSIMSFQGAGTDETTLVEVLATKTNEEINLIKEKYKECKQYPY